MMKRPIYCAGCCRHVEARLTAGREIYPHRPDLSRLPFWKCDTCGNHVGCHHKTKQPTRPLGCIPTPEIRRIRRKIHAVLDPIWESGVLTRKQVYADMAERLGHKYHTGEIRSEEAAQKALAAARHVFGAVVDEPGGVKP